MLQEEVQKQGDSLKRRKISLSCSQQPPTPPEHQGTRESAYTAALCATAMCHHGSYEAFGAAACHHPSKLLPPRGPPHTLALHLSKEGTQRTVVFLLSNTLSSTVFPTSLNMRSLDAFQRCLSSGIHLT